MQAGYQFTQLYTLAINEYIVRVLTKHYTTHQRSQRIQLSWSERSTIQNLICVQSNHGVVIADVGYFYYTNLRMILNGFS
jgi:hypothetical protein